MTILCCHMIIVFCHMTIYAGLSYCRHMKKVHHMVAHMVDASVSVQNLNPANYKEGIVKETWREFQANRNVSKLYWA